MAEEMYNITHLTDLLNNPELAELAKTNPALAESRKKGLEEQIKKAEKFHKNVEKEKVDKEARLLQLAKARKVRMDNIARDKEKDEYHFSSKQKKALKKRAAEEGYMQKFRDGAFKKKKEEILEPVKTTTKDFPVPEPKIITGGGMETVIMGGKVLLAATAAGMIGVAVGKALKVMVDTTEPAVVENNHTFEPAPQHVEKEVPKSGGEDPFAFL